MHSSKGIILFAWSSLRIHVHRSDLLSDLVPSELFRNWNPITLVMLRRKCIKKHRGNFYVIRGFQVLSLSSLFMVLILFVPSSPSLNTKWLGRSFTFIYSPRKRYSQRSLHIVPWWRKKSRLRSPSFILYHPSMLSFSPSPSWGVKYIKRARFTS